MAVTIPATDVANYNLQANITQLTALITTNALDSADLNQQLANLQWQLVSNLIANAAGQQGGGTSILNPSTILATCTVNT